MAPRIVYGSILQVENRGGRCCRHYLLPMSSQDAAERIARLAAHLNASNSGKSSSSGSSGGLDVHPTVAVPAARSGPAGASFHQKFFNFEPGRLLLDQVTIITGAGSGIGKAVSLHATGTRPLASGYTSPSAPCQTGCRPCTPPHLLLQAAILFAQQGAKVVASDLDGSKAQATADFIRNSCGTAIAVPGDVCDPAFPGKVVAAAVEAFGGLHILVNNAGFTW